MSKKQTLLMKFIIFLLWTLSSILTFWLIISAQNIFLTTLAVGYVGDDIVRGWQARFFDKAFLVIAGLVWLITTFVIEDYLRDGIKKPRERPVTPPPDAPKHDVWRRAAKIFGIELSILFILDLITTIIHKGVAGLLGLLLLLGELILGAGLLYYATKAKYPPTAQQNTP